MAQTRFRSLPLRNAPTRVDREQRVIFGASAAQAVEALGHGMLLDAKTLQQIADLGNAAKNGIKSRFTHPGLSSNGMGKHMGRMKDFRVEGDKVVGDLHLAESASKAPDGDLAGYVMDLAEEDSAAFGMSIAAEGTRVWTFANGTEVPADGDESRPRDALTTLPVLRVGSLYAVDVVDEPAANRDGMFSSALWGTNQLAESMFDEFDGVLAQMNMTPEQAWNYALRYFDARQVDLKGLPMAETDSTVEAQDEEAVAAVETENEEPSQEDEVTQEEYQALQAKLEALQAEKTAEQAKATQLAETVAAMQREARTARFNTLARTWQGETAKHVTVLEALGEGSDAYAAYVTHMNALTEQIEAGALFSEVGKESQTAGNGALSKLEAAAHRLQTDNPSLTYEQAFDAATVANKELYREYRAEMEQ